MPRIKKGIISVAWVIGILHCMGMGVVLGQSQIKFELQLCLTSHSFQRKRTFYTDKPRRVDRPPEPGLADADAFCYQSIRQSSASWYTCKNHSLPGAHGAHNLSCPVAIHSGGRRFICLSIADADVRSHVHMTSAKILGFLTLSPLSLSP